MGLQERDGAIFVYVCMCTNGGGNVYTPTLHKDPATTTTTQSSPPPQPINILGRPPPRGAGLRGGPHGRRAAHPFDLCGGHAQRGGD